MNTDERIDQNITIEPVIEIAGISIPNDIDFFDCRAPIGTPIPVSHYGEVLEGVKIAAYSVGLRLSETEKFDDCIYALAFRFDPCNPSNAHKVADAVCDVIVEYRWFKNLYDKADFQNIPKPVACYIDNEGAGVIVDMRQLTQER